jgi:hypothetical protein
MTATGLLLARRTAAPRARMCTATRLSFARMTVGPGVGVTTAAPFLARRVAAPEAHA